MRILLLSAFVCGSGAFQVSPVVHHHHAVSARARKPVASSSSLVFSSAQVEVAESEETTGLVAAKMDEALFKFDKFLIDTVYNVLCFFYPVTGKDRDFARFFVLETVARVPYFAYLSVLHLRETFGERGTGELMRVHYAEADNELHHLLIMEALGGNSSPIDRVLAQTMAFFYYWYVVVVYFLSEQAAYHLSELIEDHAYDTYNKFLNEHEEMLKSKPVPNIARKYYEEDNPFMFDTFCTVKDRCNEGKFSERRPKLANLYDVFVNIRDDEKEHWKTLCNLVQYNDIQAVDAKNVRSTEPLIIEAPVSSETTKTVEVSLPMSSEATEPVKVTMTIVDSETIGPVDVAVSMSSEATDPVEVAASMSSEATEPVSDAEDLSIPYDAPAKLAYSKSDKSMPYREFKAKYEADAVADVIAKKKTSGPVKDVAMPEASEATKSVKVTVPVVDDLSIPYDAPAKLAYSKSDKSTPYREFKAKYEADAVAGVIAKRKAP